MRLLFILILLKVRLLLNDLLMLYVGSDLNTPPFNLTLPVYIDISERVKPPVLLFLLILLYKLRSLSLQSISLKE